MLNDPCCNIAKQIACTDGRICAFEYRLGPVRSGKVQNSDSRNGHYCVGALFAPHWHTRIRSADRIPSALVSNKSGPKELIPVLVSRKQVGLAKGIYTETH